MIKDIKVSHPNDVMLIIDHRSGQIEIESWVNGTVEIRTNIFGFSKSVIVIPKEAVKSVVDFLQSTLEGQCQHDKE